MKTKKIVALLIAVTFILSALTGCGGGGNGGEADNGAISETVQLPEKPYPFVVLDNIATLATQQYVTARLYLDALIEFDMETGTEDECMTLYDDTIEQFALAEKYAEMAEEAVGLAQICIDAGIKLSLVSYNPPQSGGAVTETRTAAGNPFVLTAQAADPPPKRFEEMKRWAETIEEIANNAPEEYAENGVIGHLAKELRTDSSTAKRLLEDAKKISGLVKDSEQAQWDRSVYGFFDWFSDKGMKTAMITKSGCKVATVILGIIAIPGASALALTAKTGWLLFRGTDLILDVSSTTLSITLGENNQTAKMFDEAMDYTDLGRIGRKLYAMTFGGSDSTDGEKGGIVPAGDPVPVPGEIRGFDIQPSSPSSGGGTPAQGAVLSSFVVGDTTNIADDAALLKEVNNVRGTLGLPPLTEILPKPKPPLEKAQDTAPKVTPKSVEAYMEMLVGWMVAQGIITQEEADELLGKGAVDIEGTYVRTYTSDSIYSPYTGTMTMKVTLTDKATNTYTVVKILDDLDYNEYTYTLTAVADKNTGTVTMRDVYDDGDEYIYTFDGTILSFVYLEDGTVEDSYTLTKQ